VAEVYRSIQGKPFADWLAHTEMVDYGIRGHAMARAAIAAGILAGHRDQNHAHIEVEKQKLDYHVMLNDERGLLAAMSIEFGRAGVKNESTNEIEGGMDGLFVLHRAFGRKIKAKHRNRSRRVRRR
jgi:hypothetical protein